MDGRRFDAMAKTVAGDRWPLGRVAGRGESRDRSAAALARLSGERKVRDADPYCGRTWAETEGI